VEAASDPRHRRSAGRARDLAWAEAFAGVAQVADTLAGRLRAIHEERHVRDERNSALSEHQRQVVGLAGLKNADGLTGSEVAAAVGLERANAYRLLRRLVELGQLEEVPAERPRRWRRLGTAV
jgi:Fic family protein